MKGHKRWRPRASRLAVFAGIEPDTGKQRYVNETVHAPNNRVGAKAADTPLAELIAAVENGRTPEPARKPKANVLTVTVTALAARWQAASRPRQNERTGDWIGWSTKTAKTHTDNFKRYILPTLGERDAKEVTGLDLDDLYGRHRIPSSAVWRLCAHGQRAGSRRVHRRMRLTNRPGSASSWVRMVRATVS